MNKVYLVSVYGGEWDNTWKIPIGVCITSEIADVLKANIEEEFSSSILNDKTDDAIDILWDIEEKYDNIIEGILKEFPQLSKEKAEKVVLLYDKYPDYEGVIIEEINFYTKSSDIFENGIEY